MQKVPPRGKKYPEDQDAEEVIKQPYDTRPGESRKLFER